ncbi:hypothetical protein D3C87_1510330 [compost metagenome]
MVYWAYSESPQAIRLSRNFMTVALAYAPMRNRAMRCGSKGCASQSWSAAAVSGSAVPCCALAASVARMCWICWANHVSAFIS